VDFGSRWDRGPLGLFLCSSTCHFAPLP
jgi:hypothetical protein